MSISTSVTDHLDFENVYEPAEDSFILLDAIEKDLNKIKSELQPQFAVEIGSGSGIILCALAENLPNCQVFALDINPDACKATIETAKVNNVQKKVNVVKCDFLQHFPIRNPVDLIVCNPPYVSTVEEEIRLPLKKS